MLKSENRKQRDAWVGVGYKRLLDDAPKLVISEKVLIVVCLAVCAFLFGALCICIAFMVINLVLNPQPPPNCSLRSLLISRVAPSGLRPRSG